MKKFFAFALILMLSLSLLTACGGSGRNNGGPSGNGDNNGEAFGYGNGRDYIASHLGDYSVTYQYSVGGAGVALVVTGIRTSEGYYYSISGMETLYIKNGNNYDKYFNYGTGYIQDDGSFTQAQVESDMSLITEFMTQYVGDISGMKKEGTATVAGRSCDKYSFSGAGVGAAMRYFYYIDKETGVCLKWDYDASVGGENFSVTFECTEFKTSGISLPRV